MKLTTVILLLFTLVSFDTLALAQNTKQELNDQLWEAARAGDTAAVTALLDKGADVNAKFRYGATALFKAAERGHADVVKLLLARGADVSVKDTFYGATAMTWALDQKHVEVVRALLEKDTASVDSVLITGANEGNADLVRVALERGGVKPGTLTVALVASQAEKDRAEIVELLKKAGAQPPFAIDAETLQTYAGRYKPEEGADVLISVKEGQLIANFGGQAITLMALDKTTFRPVAFEGLTIAFNSEAGKVSGFSLKQQGRNTNVFKKVVE